MLNQEALDDIISYLSTIRDEGCRELYLPASVCHELFQNFNIQSVSESPRFPPARGDGSFQDVGTDVLPAKSAVAADEDSAKVDRAGEAKPAGGASTVVSRPAPATSESAFEPPAEWGDLRDAAVNCNRCSLHKMRSQAVFEKGSRQAELMFIGDVPPDDEGEQMLARMYQAMQFSPEQVYFAYIVKCRPPGRRRPEPAEVSACIPYLKMQIKLVRPRVIVLLGEMALYCLLGHRSITRWRGQWLQYRDIPVMSIYNPLFMRTHPESKKEAWEDLKQVMCHCGRDPGRKKG